MSTSKTNWAGDYSYLLHSIEDRLSSQIPETEIKKSAAKNINDLSSINDEYSQLLTTRKRLRLSDINSFRESAMKNNDDLTENRDIHDNDVPHENRPYMSRSYVFQLETSLEEAKLGTEELKDKVSRVQLEMKHVSEKYLRQLSFMETEVTRLQKALEEKNEKYYDEKKKWQAKVRGLESEIEKLNHSISSASKNNGSVIASIKSNEAVVNEWKDKYSTVEKELANEKLEASTQKQEVEKYKALYEALQGYTRTDVLPTYTKVLHMSMNPYSLAQQQRGHHDEISKSTVPIVELRRLRQKIKQLQQHHQDQQQALNTTIVQPRQHDASHMFNTSPDGTHLQPTSSTTTATTNAPDSNKLNQRLKEMFKERITSFREAVYLLTGYKVDLYTTEEESKSGSGNESKRLRLRSMYAEWPEDSLIFQWRGETLELLETPFASRLDPKLYAYLNRSNSVPVFLSNITMELFENQTFMG